jgi:hypothetical protein
MPQAFAQDSCQLQLREMNKQINGLKSDLLQCQAQNNRGELARLQSENQTLRAQTISLSADNSRISQDLRQCQEEARRGGGRGDNNRRELEQLRSQNAQLAADLRQCQENDRRPGPFPSPFPNRGELERLQNENRQLSAENINLRGQVVDLQQQLDRALGRGPEIGQFCYAACTQSDRVTPVLSNIGAGIARNQLEARQVALQDLQRQYSCTWGVTNVACEAVQTDRQANYCTAACTQSDRRTPVMNNSAGAYGRNETEARYNSLKELGKKYSCTWGTAVVECSR